MKLKIEEESNNKISKHKCIKSSSHFSIFWVVHMLFYKNTSGDEIYILHPPTQKYNTSSNFPYILGKYFR